jgi:peptide deformylase
MKLITDANPDALKILQTPSEQMTIDDNTLEFGLDMIKLMYEVRGLALSAIQVGVPKRMFVMRGTVDRGDFICVNPRIVRFSDETISLEESCLSFPGVVIKVKRPRHIRMRFTVPDGNVVTQQFTGMTARAVQHEMDHLNGELWYMRAHKYHRDLGFKNRSKYSVSKNKEVFMELSPFDVQ